MRHINVSSIFTPNLVHPKGGLAIEPTVGPRNGDRIVIGAPIPFQKLDVVRAGSRGTFLPCIGIAMSKVYRTLKPGSRRGPLDLDAHPTAGPSP